MKITKFIKNEPVLIIAGILAIITMFFVPIDKSYIDYINFDVLIILFCLMAVVEGIRRTGAFDKISHSLMKRVSTDRQLIIILCMVCFFSSAFITNDIALITFVPFSLALMKGRDSFTIIRMVTLETVSANLGSLITPIGNPQNLHLYTYFNVSLYEFFMITLPLGGICLLLIFILCLFVKGKRLNKDTSVSYLPFDGKSLVFYLILFLVCILSVLGVVPYVVTLVFVSTAVFMKDKSVFKKVDYILLATFVFFFVFVGNIARIDDIYRGISYFVQGKVLEVSALISQVISNVPAAAMLSGFTDDYRELILGTNIGGLGTIIASMASLISFRQISSCDDISKGKYLLYFTIINVILLTILLVIYHVGM